MADLGDITTLKASYDTRVNDNTSGAVSPADVRGSLVDTADTLDALMNAGPAERTGSTIAFDQAAIYNTPTSPSNGAVTLDLSGAVAGTEVVGYFNHAAEPSWPSGVTAVGLWNNSQLNVVRFLFLDSNDISAQITSDASVSPVATWTKINRMSAQTLASSTVLTADDTLRFAMLANTSYHVRAQLYGGQASGAGDFKYGFTGPASPTLIRASAFHSSTGTAPAAYAQGSYETTGKQFTATGAALHSIRIDLYIKNGANAGDFTFTFAQIVSDVSAVNMAEGSWMEYIVAT